MGRESTNDIVVEQPAVSRRHASIFYNAQGYWIQDLGSQNGTFVDGQGIGQQPRSLENGERIQLGSNAKGTIWEFCEAQEAGPSLESPPTIQISAGSPVSVQAPPVQSHTQGEASTEEGTSPCSAFSRNAGGSWTCKSFIAFDTSDRQIEVSRGTTFLPDNEFMGFDLAKWLDDNCPGGGR